MFTRKAKQKSGLEEAIESLLCEMKTVRSDTESYSKMATELQKLYNLKTVDGCRKVSPDILVTILGNLVGILLIVGHERANTVTSKALNFVMKLK